MVPRVCVSEGPGTGAQQASQLGVGADHVWVGAAENDPVSHLPSKGEAGGVGGVALGGMLAGPGAAIAFGVSGLVSHATDPHELWFGQDPASSEFGANRFPVAPGGSSAHSDYWNHQGNQPSTSLSSMADIVSGHGDRVARQENR